MKPKTLLTAGLLLVSALNSAHAIQLGIQPATHSVAPHASFDLALAISGLGDGTAPSLGVFDLTVAYDPAILQFEALDFGDPALGDQLDLFGLAGVTGVDTSVPGIINLFELSLDAPQDLEALQAGDFTLSVFTFTALAPGVSALDLSVNALGDAWGDPLFATLTSGRVTVTGVPEQAATGWLLAVGAIALLYFQKGRTYGTGSPNALAVPPPGHSDLAPPFPVTAQIRG